ncbi:MAG TPA: hypothetical protein VF039_10595 [Longimicrobiales bacterium]
MSEAPAAQRCPYCGQQPMSRIRYLLVPGTRSTCTRCGRRIRVDISRRSMLLLIGLGAVMGGLIVWLAGDWIELVVGLTLALIVAFAFDQWAWHTKPWLPDEPVAQPAAEPALLETADR